MRSNVDGTARDGYVSVAQVASLHGQTTAWLARRAEICDVGFQVYASGWPIAWLAAPKVGATGLFYNEPWPDPALAAEARPYDGWVFVAEAFTIATFGVQRVTWVFGGPDRPRGVVFSDDLAECGRLVDHNALHLSPESFAKLARCEGWQNEGGSDRVAAASEIEARQRKTRVRDGAALVRERTLHRVIGILLLKLQEERKTAAARKPDLDTVRAEVTADAEALARQYRRHSGLAGPDLPNKFGLSDDTVRRELKAGLDAIVEDDWNSDPK